MTIIYICLNYLLEGMCSFRICFRFWVKKTNFCKELRDIKFLQVKAKLFPVLSMVATTKRVWSAWRYDLKSESHNMCSVSLGYIFCLFFSFTIVKTNSLQGASVHASNLLFIHVFSMQPPNAWSISKEAFLNLYFWVVSNLDSWLKALRAFPFAWFLSPLL